MQQAARLVPRLRRCQKQGRSIPGIGPPISSAIVAAIGTGASFSKGRDFGAWLGPAPKQMSTSDRTILGHNRGAAIDICKRCSLRQPGSCWSRSGLSDGSARGPGPPGRALRHRGSPHLISRVTTRGPRGGEANVAILPRICFFEHGPAVGRLQSRSHFATYEKWDRDALAFPASGRRFLPDLGRSRQGRVVLCLRPSARSAERWNGPDQHPRGQAKD